MTQTYFITATGTDIGKTLVTTALCHQLIRKQRSVMALKPVISGYEEGAESDTLQILHSLQLEADEEMIDTISPWRFTAPLSPHIAAELEDCEIDFDALVDYCQMASGMTDTLLIEGVGGVMVPLCGRKTTLDWMQALRVPAIVVAGSYLGSISHTLTALRVLEKAEVPVQAVVVSQSVNCVGLDAMLQTLHDFTPTPLFAIPRLDSRTNIYHHVGDLLGVFEA